MVAISASARAGQ
jgi:hypothetical protein